MHLYARPSKLLLTQVLADAALFAWFTASWWLGRAVDGFVRGLGQPATDAAHTATQVKDELADAATQVKDLPLIGEQLRNPFDQVSRSLDGLVKAADAQVTSINQAATVAGWVTFVAPVLLALAFWLPWRVTYMRTASLLRDLSMSPAGDELLALRALTTQPLSVLMHVVSDPAAAWRSGDPQVLRRLADVELRAHGVQRCVGVGQGSSRRA